LSRRRAARGGSDHPSDWRTAGHRVEPVVGLSNLRARQGWKLALELRDGSLKHDRDLWNTPSGEGTFNRSGRNSAGCAEDARRATIRNWVVRQVKFRVQASACSFAL